MAPPERLGPERGTRQAVCGNPLPVPPAADHVAVAEPSPPSRTKWTRRVPHPVLIGHAASLSQPSSDPLEAVDTHGYIEHAPQDQRAAQRAWLV
jgi:hypothetical protein